MSDKHTPVPWRLVELVNEDGSSMTPEDAAEFSANTAKHGESGFYAVHAKKDDGKTYIVCFVGNGPDSIDNGLVIQRAVNHHAELAEALRALRDQCDMNLPDPIPESIKQELRAADELLAKLETDQ